VVCVVGRHAEILKGEHDYVTAADLMKISMRA
jgi:hypothetical protein